MDFLDTPKADPHYGALSANLPDCLKDDEHKYYLSTAISYTNGNPHIGHAYEFLTADVLVRFHRVLGYDTFFLTGSDEHGQKVASSAEALGRAPLEHCDEYVKAFKAIDERLKVRYSDYIRTTDPRHEATAQNLWVRCHARGDIYLSSYEGWYNEREETFVSDADAEAAGFKDPGNGADLKRVVEESYFFKMSNYTDRLIKYLEDNPTFLEPEQYRNSILYRLRKEGLKDLSISRTSFTWGIPVPEGFDQRHVMYVWFDALSNYLSGVHYLDGCSPPHDLSRYWPAHTHLIGKDIVWFHSVIWPCMLMSAELPLPKKVFCHGFVNAADGRKMSKSYNNSVDPNAILDKYSPDSLRYYCCSASSYGSDLNFSEESLIQMHNSELADILGNLVHRVMNLTVKYCDGVIPDCTHDTAFPLPFDLAALKAGVEEDLKASLINQALFKAMEAARATNRYLTEAEPWKMKGDDEPRRICIVRTSMEAVYAFTHFLAPVLPMAAQAVFEKLGTPPVCSFNLKDDFYNLTPGTPIAVGAILFQKIETPEADVGAAAVAGKVGDKKGPLGKKGAPPVEEESVHSLDFTKVDIRVGRITKVCHHATAERLYCEEIDCGEESGPRQVCSGLREFYSIEELTNRKVLVVCNLKESKFQGFMSYGMVLAAKMTDATGAAGVQLVDPPADCAVGSRVVPVGDHIVGTPFPAAKMKKLKVWEAVSPLLKSDDSCIVCWNNIPLTVQGSSSGSASDQTPVYCTLPSFAGAQVS